MSLTASASGYREWRSPLRFSRFAAGVTILALSVSANALTSWRRSRIVAAMTRTSDRRVQTRQLRTIAKTWSTSWFDVVPQSVLSSARTLVACLLSDNESCGNPLGSLRNDPRDSAGDYRC